MSIPTIPRVQQEDLPEFLRTFDARKDSFGVYPDLCTLAFPRGTVMKLSAHKLVKMPVHEHMDHLILFVRHFKYEGAVTKNKVYSWLSWFHGQMIFLDSAFRVGATAHKKSLRSSFSQLRPGRTHGYTDGNPRRRRSSCVLLFYVLKISKEIIKCPK